MFIGAFFDSPGISARQALLPELAQAANVSHERANTAYSLIRRIAGLLGPPIAGLLLAAVGATNLLFFNAATFVASALIVAFTVPDLAVHRVEGAVTSVRGYVRDVAEGFRYLASNRLIVWIVLTGSLGSLVAEPLYTVILPVYANEVLGSAAQLGFIYSALAAGSILGNFLYLAIESRVPRGVIQIGGFGLRALAFSVMLFMPDWWVIALALFFGAVALEPVNPMMMSILQEQVPPGMRARIYSVGSALFVVTAAHRHRCLRVSHHLARHGRNAGNLRGAQSGPAARHALRARAAAYPETRHQCLCPKSQSNSTAYDAATQSEWLRVAAHCHDATERCQSRPTTASTPPAAARPSA